MRNRQLYKASKRVYKEAILHAQIQSAGSSQQRFLERIKTDKIARAPDIIYKVLATIYIASLAFIPIISVSSMYQNLAQGASFEWINLANSLVNGAFFFVQLMILVVFALMTAWGIMSGGPYEWIHTLPFSRKDIEKVGLFTFVRSINVQLIAMTLVLPIGMIVVISLTIGPYIAIWKSISIVLISTLLSIVNTCFNIGLLVISSRKLAIVMEEYDFASKKASFIRIFTMLAYFLVSMFIVSAVNLSLQNIGAFYGTNLLASQNSNSINFILSSIPHPFTNGFGNSTLISNILSFIPYPFSSGFLMSMFILDFNGVAPITIIGSVIGFLLFCLLTFLVVKKSLQILRNISSPEIKRKEIFKKKTTVEDISTKNVSPIKAFVKRDLSIITRETQQIIVLILPIMIPIYTVIVGYVEDFKILGNTAVTMFFIILMFYVITNTMALVVSVTTIESGGETIMAALPIDERDKMKSKIPYFFGTIVVAVLLSLLIQIKSPIFLGTLYLTLSFLPVFPIVGVAGLLLKVRLFGKFRHKYVVEEIKADHKFSKYMLILLLVSCLMALFIYAAIVGYWLIFTVEAISIVCLVLIFNYMFPKKNWKIKYIF
ncbi:MAG: hypothetical protein ACTSQF_11840 [Candidatus Heimdallarchaeaceae archaeon]